MFSILKELIIHKKSHRALKQIKCPLCQYTGFSRDILIQHYTGDHFLQIENEKLQFDTFEEFELWKANIERETFASFTKYGTTKRPTMLYACHRSGVFKSGGKNLRKLKAQGSNKIGGFCPARINLKMKGNKCEISFCKSHVGHKQEHDLNHLFLTKAQRELVAAKIAAKIPFDDILNEVRDSISDRHLERTHLLKKKDLYNIEQSFKLSKSAVHQSNDAISIGTWVNKMKTSGSVLFHKQQQTLCEEYPQLQSYDFCLIIMTNGQKELLLKFSEDCICIDGTHELNQFGFELHTLLVLDDMREGYPSAFLISNRSDSTVMKIFFKCVQECVGKKIKPKIFMSGMADDYYNAWVGIMEPAEFK